MRKIQRPIFISGTGRSGTTLLFQLLGMHHDLAWFSSWSNHVPQMPQISIISRIYDIPYFQRQGIENMSAWPRPAEAYKIWDHCFEGFSGAREDWCSDHVTTEGVMKIKRVICAHLKWMRKKRFVAKYTGWPRWLFIQHIFPDADMVWIDRDPRAVVISLMAQRWEDAWWERGRISHVYEEKSLTKKSEFYAELYLKYYERVCELSDEISIKRISYEQLVSDPFKTMRNIISFVGLEWSPAYEQYLLSVRMNDACLNRWRSKVSSKVIEQLSVTLGKPIRELGYRV